MSKLEKHINCEITLVFEKNIICSELEDIFKGSIFEKDKDAVIIGLNSDNHILCIDNEIIFYSKDFNYIFDMEKKARKLIEVQEDNVCKDINLEVVTVHDSENSKCLNLFEATEREKKLDILFKGYTLFTKDDKSNPCVVEVSPMFTDGTYFYTKFLSKYNLDKEDIFELIQNVEDYLNDDFSNKIYNFINGGE